MSKTFKVTLFALLFLLPSTTFATSFYDVSESHPNFGAIEFLKQANVINGYEDGSFKPDNKVNRAESLKMILLSAGVYVSGTNSGANTFSDVDQNAWFFNYINSAVTKNIINFCF